MVYARPEMPRSAGVFVGNVARSDRHGPFRRLARVRYQLAGGLLFTVLLPALLRAHFDPTLRMASLENTVFGTAIAMIVGTYVIRRVLSYPGVHAISYVPTIFLAAYGAVALAFLLLRIEYSRFQLLASFMLAIPWFTIGIFAERHYRRPLFAVLPVGDTSDLCNLPQADWWPLRDSTAVPLNTSGVVADLRADMPPEWTKLLAASALKGLPVYHSKHVIESLTGRVQIEHLSENSLGSLLPSSIYLKLKRVLDGLGVLIALPAILLVGGIAAFFIKREDKGPVFFTQPRIGLGGERFTIFKFRTMRTDAADGAHYTKHNDPRITRVGKILRRYRIDELPQVLNILRGEMSWIGPRPESLPLAAWYEERIPFYSYRHIVRPGISGWAQVQQGHVALVEAAQEKLHFDFFYIKHFSPWLDLLITARTIWTVLSGFGAR